MSRILAVEDDADLLKLMAHALSKQGHEVWTAEDGEIALELAVATLPDVVVTDLVMPILDGYELLGKLRGCAETQGIPVIVLSECQGKDWRLAAFRLGCDDFLPKPFEFEELCLRVEHVLRAQGGVPSTAQVKMQGHLGDLALPSVLALLETDRQTGVLDLGDGELRIRLFLEDGRVVHAMDAFDPARVSFDVLCDALRLKSGEFTVRNDPIAVPHDLKLPTTQLLLNAFEKIDEDDAADRA